MYVNQKFSYSHVVVSTKRKIRWVRGGGTPRLDLIGMVREGLSWRVKS